MNYDEALSFIHSRLRFGVCPGLERIEKFLSKIGNPHLKLSAIHIAGTNGKGSTCRMLGAILSHSGYKTGCYYSPYVTDFRDRMQIDGKMISKRELAELITELKPLIEESDMEGTVLTEFELVTVAAFLWFYRMGCERVVLETGLGGRLDATNVIPSPMLSVLTPIGLDHTKILGDTLSKIAFEKCGIIKRGINVVTSPNQETEALNVIRDTCISMDSKLTEPDTSSLNIISSSLNGSSFSYKGEKYRVRMPGMYQCLNAITVIEAARLISIPDKAIKDGLLEAVLPARMEVIREDPLLMVDGAHNPHAAAALSQSLRTLYPGMRVVAVMGMMADKDCEQVVSILSPLFQKVYTCSPRNTRALSASALSELVRSHGVDSSACSSPEEALEKALLHDSAVIVCGSFYLAGDIWESLERLKSVNQVNMP